MGMRPPVNGLVLTAKTESGLVLTAKIESGLVLTAKFEPHQTDENFPTSRQHNLITSEAIIELMRSCECAWSKDEAVQVW